MLVPPPGGKKRASSTALPALPPASPAPAGPVVLAYLVSTVLENPFELRSTGSCEIGRGDENDIVLPVHQVSRQHALIKWDGDSFAIIDRGSTNGIYVNGEPVKRKRLQVGDLIGIGPFDMTFQETIDAGQAPKQEETVVVTTPGSFAGELSDVSVSEVCQLIDLNQKTGILDFHYGDRRGKVYFEKGQATHAEYRELIADNAALELLSLTRGSFRFIAKESVTVQRTIKRPTASLLLEAARRADESK
jgi:pSer/pThr/pTyr-binding forkhead associated (FHA) protein